MGWAGETLVLIRCDRNPRWVWPHRHPLSSRRVLPRGARNGCRPPPKRPHGLHRISVHLLLSRRLLPSTVLHSSLLSGRFWSICFSKRHPKSPPNSRSNDLDDPFWWIDLCREYKSPLSNNVSGADLHYFLFETYSNLLILLNSMNIKVQMLTRYL
jgi:hypothetical protein